MRGGRRNDPSQSTLDKLKFTRISMLTDPALDAGRHEFRVRTLLGRNLPAEQLPLKVEGDKLLISNHTFIPPAADYTDPHRQHVHRRSITAHVGRSCNGNYLSE